MCIFLPIQIDWNRFYTESMILSQNHRIYDSIYDSIQNHSITLLTCTSPLIVEILNNLNSIPAIIKASNRQCLHTCACLPILRYQCGGRNLGEQESGHGFDCYFHAYFENWPPSWTIGITYSYLFLCFILGEPFVILESIYISEEEEAIHSLHLTHHHLFQCTIFQCVLVHLWDIDVLFYSNDHHPRI